MRSDECISFNFKPHVMPPMGHLHGFCYAAVMLCWLGSFQGHARTTYIITQGPMVHAMTLRVILAQRRNSVYYQDLPFLPQLLGAANNACRCAIAKTGNPTIQCSSRNTICVKHGVSYIYCQGLRVSFIGTTQQRLEPLHSHRLYRLHETNMPGNLHI